MNAQITKIKLSNKNINRLYILMFVLSLLIIWNSCTKDDSTLAPYVGSPVMSNISIESGTTTPKFTWIGGYATVFGVNLGNRPALDSTLIWLAYQAGNQLKYPLTYAELPSGAVDLTSDYGGTFVPELVEDSTYSFWVMKEADWNQISSSQNKYFNLDSALNSISIDGDTINFPPQNYTQLITPLDNYINIKDVTTRGRLAIISVTQPTTDNNPIIDWEIIQSGVTDTLISVIGICASNQYNPGALVWQVYSVQDSGGTTYYGKKNVIPGPLITGEEFAETIVFVEYPEDGLERDQTYYLYIANADWNGEDHGRVVNYYCYVTFNTY